MSTSTSYDIRRLVFFFDTSGLSDTVVITEVVLGLYGKTDVTSTDFNMTVVSYAGAQPPTVDDYNDFGTASLGQLTTVGFTISDYNNITLNADGRAAISKTATTALGVRSDREIAGTEPTFGVYEYVVVWMADEENSALDPKLVVTYTLPVDIEITVPVASLYASGYVPAITAGTGVVLDVPSATIQVVTHIPVVLAGTGFVLDIPVASVIVQAPAPSVIAGTGVLLNVPVVSIVSHTQPPTVSSGVTISPPAVSILVVAPSPSLSSSVNVSVPAAMTQAVAPSPSLSSGVTINVPVVSIIAMAGPRSVLVEPWLPYPVYCNLTFIGRQYAALVADFAWKATVRPAARYHATLKADFAWEANLTFIGRWHGILGKQQK
jgi:hypothetical protein